MKSVSRVIFIIIFVGILLKAIKTLYAQNNAEFIYTELVYEWYFKVGYYGNIMISVAAILSFVFYRKYFPTYVSVCYLLMLLLVIITSLGDLEEIMLKPSIFYTVKGIGTFLNFGILFFAASTSHFHKILKLFYYICFAFIIAGIINLSKLGFGASRIQYLDALREFAVYLIWVFPFFLLQDEENKKTNILNLLIFGITFIFILCTGSRSYLVIYVLYFLAKFKDQLKTKNSLVVIFGTLILIAGGVFIFANSGLDKALEGAVSNLTERASEDSRSEQLVEFMGQYDADYLIQGVGPMGTWNWSKWPAPYYYLDNQFLLLLWWAGLPALLAYLYFVIRPITQKAEILYFENIKGVKMILIMWLLACAGFAIYVGICSDPYYDFITLLIGLQACKYTLLQSDDEE
jgi:hypothetical protein